MEQYIVLPIKEDNNKITEVQKLKRKSIVENSHVS
jgi:hypothetical protein